MGAAAAAASTAVCVRSFLSREEVAALSARLERLPLQPYTSCDEDVVGRCMLRQGRPRP